MTPYEVGILLHYYASARDPEPEQFDMRAQVWRPTIEMFRRMELIEEESAENAIRSWRLTAKGNCYVTDGICNVPLPQPKWHIPHVCPAA